MRKLLGMPKDTFLPMSAILAFIGMIAVLMIVKKTTGRTFIGYRAPLYAYSGKARHGITAKGRAKGRRRVPANNMHPAWRRSWDKMSGSSSYSKDMLQGRKMGAHISVA